MAIGDITGTIASYEWDTVRGDVPNIIHIAGNIYAIAYRGPDSDGWLKTVSISDDGLTISEVASLEFDPVSASYPDIIHIAGNIYAIAYTGPDTDGWLKTVSISDDGLILSNTGASLEFDTSQGYYPDIIHIAGNIYAIAYMGLDNDGWLQTVSISDNGLTLSNVASLLFEPGYATTPVIIHMLGNIYAIAHEGSDDDGWLKTVSISDNGLTLSNVASYEFDGVHGENPNIIHIAGNICAIAYTGPGYDGWLKTVSISDDGLTLSTVASYEFDASQGIVPDSIHIAGNVYAIAYLGPGGDGWLKTIGIVTSEAAAVAFRQLFTGGLSHRPIRVQHVVGGAVGFQHIWVTAGVGDLNTAVEDHAGCGTQDAGLSFGGNSGGGTAETEEYNGSSWTTAGVGDLNMAREGLAGCGTQDAGLSFGGYSGDFTAETEEYNGSSWTTAGVGDLNTAVERHAGCGTQDSGLSFGGDTGGVTAETEEYNGSSWTTAGVGDLNTAVFYHKGCGTQDAGLSFGGMNAGGVTLAETEEYNGSSWTTAGVGDLNTAVNTHAGCGIQSAGLSFGGDDGALTAETEEYV